MTRSGLSIKRQNCKTHLFSNLLQDVRLSSTPRFLIDPLKYLNRNFINLPSEEPELFCLCLNYLQLPAFHPDLTEDEIHEFASKGHYEFMGYAIAS